MTLPLRVLSVGTGYFSQFHFDAWARCPEVQIVGVCDLDLNRAKTVADQYGGESSDNFAALLDRTKPDLVDITTPPDTHLELIELAARHGANIVCQKPFCGSLDAARRAAEIGETANVDITVHENFRFQPWYQAIKTHLLAGKIGDIYQVTFRLRPGDGQGADAYMERQPYFQKMSRFLVHETGVHYVDVFRFLLGEMTSLSADLSKLNPVIEGEDACLITMQFANGTRALLDGNRLADHSADFHRLTMGEMLIEGSKGVLELDGNAEITFRAKESTEKQVLPYDWKDRGFGGDCVYNFTRHIVDHYVAGSDRVNSAREYMKNLEIEEAIYASDAEGARKKINPS